MQISCSARVPLIATCEASGECCFSGLCCKLSLKRNAGCVSACPCCCSAAALAAAHLYAAQAAEAAAGATSAGLQHWSSTHSYSVTLLPRWCPQLVDSALMARLLQEMCSLPTVSRLLCALAAASETVQS